MPNKQLFQHRMRHERKVDTENSAGGTAYAKDPEVALAQLATTGTFGDTFYRQAGDQVETMLKLADMVSAEFLAKLAIYAGQIGKMKDMPAYLTAYLIVKAKKDESYVPYARVAFYAVIRNGRMLRNLVLFLRSGTVLGNKSLGTRTQRWISLRLNAARDNQIINWSVGNDPSLADVIKLARPNPDQMMDLGSTSPEGQALRRAQRRGLYGWVIGKEIKNGKLDGKPAAQPRVLQQLLAFQKDPGAYMAEGGMEVPDVEFRLLTGSAKLPVEAWKQIAGRMHYNALRMNLQALHKQGCFADNEFAQHVARRLRDEDNIRKARVFPYQLWTAARQLRGIADFPRVVSDAMEDAVDIALDNIPVIDGKVAICIDISSSMSSPITGYGASGRASTVRCVDVAALIAAGITRKNPDAKTYLFNTEAQPFAMSHRDSVTSNAKRISDKLCGGTNCGAALHAIATEARTSKDVPDLIVMVSDNESWYGHSRGWGQTRNYTPALEAWKKLHAAKRSSKFICIDLTPNTNQQVPDAPNRATVGGFSDDTFNMIGDLYNGVEDGVDVWLKKIGEIPLDLERSELSLTTS